MNPFRLRLQRACSCRLRVLLGVMATLWILVANQGWAASSDYLIDVWRGESGLPSSSVTSIAQTPDGYLWIGTYNGLARFDGVRFVKSRQIGRAHV